MNDERATEAATQEAAKPEAAGVPAVRDDDAMALVKAGEFGKFEIVGADFTSLDAVRENVGDEGLSQFDLDRIKIPGSGNLAWEIPGAGPGGGPGAAMHFDALILHKTDQRAYWSKTPEEAGGPQPPDCSSKDCRTGFGDPGGACLSCPMAQFGSKRTEEGKPESKAQACQHRRLLFLIRPTGILPVALSLPPTSLKASKQFLLRIGSQGIPYYGLLTRFSITKAVGGGNEYGVVKMAHAEHVEGQEGKPKPLTAEQVAFVKSLRSQYIPAFERAPLRTDDFRDADAPVEGGDDIPNM